MQRDTETTVFGQPVAFSDGFGDRVVLRDEATGDACEKLYLRPVFKPQQRSVQERASRLVNFTHIRFARVRGLETEGDQLVLVSDHVPGTRLSTLLDVAADHGLRVDVDTALHLTRELLSALAVLHDSRNVTHGVLSPERLVLTPKWRLVVVDYALGLAVDRLKLSRSRLWNDLRVPMPPAAGVVRFDRRADVAQIGMVALALVLGRQVRRDEYPNRIRALLDEAAEWRRTSRTTPLGAELRAWFEHVLPIESRRPFTTIRDAQKGLEDVISQSADYRPALGALKDFLKRHDDLIARLMPASGAEAATEQVAEQPETAAAPEAVPTVSSDSGQATRAIETAASAETPAPSPAEATAADTPAEPETKSRAARPTERPRSKASARSGATRDKTRKVKKVASPPAVLRPAPQPADDSEDEIAWIEAELARLAREGALEATGSSSPAQGDAAVGTSAVEHTAPASEPPTQPAAAVDAPVDPSPLVAAPDAITPAASLTEDAVDLTPIEITAIDAMILERDGAVVDGCEAGAFEASPDTVPQDGDGEIEVGDVELGAVGAVLVDDRDVVAGSTDESLDADKGGVAPQDQDVESGVWELDVAAIATIEAASAGFEAPPAETEPVVDGTPPAAVGGTNEPSAVATPDAGSAIHFRIPEASGSATSGGAPTPARDDDAGLVPAGEVVRQAEPAAATPAPVETADRLEAAEQPIATIGAAPEWTLTAPTPDMSPAADPVDEATGPAVEAAEPHGPLASELTASLPFDQESVEPAAIPSAQAEPAGRILETSAEPEDSLAQTGAAEIAPSGHVQTSGAQEPGAPVESTLTALAGIETADPLAATDEADLPANGLDVSAASLQEAPPVAPADDAQAIEEARSTEPGWLDNIGWLRIRRDEPAPSTPPDEASEAVTAHDGQPEGACADEDREHQRAGAVAGPTGAIELSSGDDEPIEDAGAPPVDALETAGSTDGLAAQEQGSTQDAAAPGGTSLWDRFRAIGRRTGRRSDTDNGRASSGVIGLSFRYEAGAGALTASDRSESPREQGATAYDIAASEEEPTVHGTDAPSPADGLGATESAADPVPVAAGDARTSADDHEPAAEAPTTGSVEALPAAGEHLAAAPSQASAVSQDAGTPSSDELATNGEPLSEAPEKDAPRAALEAVAPKEQAPAASDATPASPRGYVDVFAVAPPPMPVVAEPVEESASLREAGPNAEATPSAEPVSDSAPSRATPQPPATEAETAADSQSAPPHSTAGEPVEVAAAGQQPSRARKGRRKGKGAKPRKGKSASPGAVVASPAAVIDSAPREAPAQAIPAPPEPAAPQSGAALPVTPEPAAPAQAGPSVDASPSPHPALAARDALLPPWLRGRSAPGSPQTAGDSPAAPATVAAAPPTDPSLPLPASAPPTPQLGEPQHAWPSGLATAPADIEPTVAVEPLRIRDEDEGQGRHGERASEGVGSVERNVLGAVRRRALDWRRIAAASVVLVLLEGASFAAVYWMMTPTQLGTLAVQTNPTGIEVLVDGRPHGLTPILEELPPGRYVLELRGRKETRVVPVEITAGVHTAQFIDWPKEVLTGGVRIVSVPEGADVTIDGISYGPAPVEVPGLTAGRHFVVISGHGGSVSTTVHVLADRMTEFEVSIFSGWLAVFAPVKLDLFERGKALGTSEDGRILVAPGRHEIEAVSERLGYRAVFRVDVLPGEVTPLSIDLPPGSLIVEGADGSEVWVDGRLAGVAPLAAIDVPLGTRKIELRYADGRVERFTEVATLGRALRVTPRQLVGRNAAGARP